MLPRPGCMQHTRRTLHRKRGPTKKKSGEIKSPLDRKKTENPRMKKIIPSLSLAALAAATLLSIPAVQAQQGPPPPGYGPDYGHEVWAAPPAELQGIQSQGFHDGIEGARKDAENHRPPSVENRDEYRHPPVHSRDKGAYREGFRRGYQVGVEHLMRGGPRPY